MELNVLNEQGQETAKVAASDTVFGREYNEALVHQLVVAYQANARMGTRAQLNRRDPAIRAAVRIGKTLYVFGLLRAQIKIVVDAVFVRVPVARVGADITLRAAADRHHDPDRKWPPRG